MTFNTHDYEFAHGKKPRGTGNWAFSPYRQGGALGKAEDRVWFYGGFAEVKKQAAAWAKKRGVDELFVLS